MAGDAEADDEEAAATTEEALTTFAPNTRRTAAIVCAEGADG